MATLCIDTATENGTVALARDAEVIASRSWRSTARHGENLFGHIDSLLHDSGVARDQITLVGVDIGPGKFTSLRVGLSTAKGLALGLDVPIVGVGSLRVLARSARGTVNAVHVPLMNAYRGDLFAAAYAFDGEEAEELLGPTFGPPENVLDQVRRAVGDRLIEVCGEAAVTHADILPDALGARSAPTPVISPSPSALALEVELALRASGPADLAGLEPRYLRPSDAKLPNAPPLATNES